MRRFKNVFIQRGSPAKKRTRKQIFITAGVLALVVAFLPFVGLGGSATDPYDNDSDTYKIDLDVEFASVAPGSGTEGEPYLLSTAENLDWFAEQVNGGSTSIHAKMTANITASEGWTGIGTESNPFSGTFDGDGYTLTVSFDASANDAAPFPRAAGATIKNLTVAGTIKTSAQFAAGLIGQTNGSGATLEKCVSNVTIDSSKSGDGTHGGLIGVVRGTTTISNCAFTGRIDGSNTDSCGGFVGWAEGSTTISNSYITAEFTVSDSNSSVFSRNGNNATVTKCYYLNSFGSDSRGGNASAVQKTAEEFHSGKVAHLLDSEWGQDLSDPTSLPTPGGDPVYASSPCASQFSNSPIIEAVQHSHSAAMCFKCMDLFPVTFSVKNMFDEGVSGATVQLKSVTAGGMPVTNAAGFDSSGEYTTTGGDFVAALPAGEYVLTAVSTPGGYISNQSAEFTVSGSAATVTMTFRPLLKVQVFGSDGLSLANASCELTGVDTGGSPVSFTDPSITIDEGTSTNVSRTANALTWTSGSDPFLLAGLPSGTYTLRLTSVPTGDLNSIPAAVRELTFAIDGAAETTVSRNLLATTVAHVHNVCGGDCAAPDCATAHADEYGWLPITMSNIGTIDLTGDAYFYLDEDIELTDAIVISGDIYLCLNGHTINKSSGIVVEVSGGGTLHLCDCSDSKSGKIAGNSDYGVVNIFDDNATFNVYSGTISGKANFGLVYIRTDANAALNMYGGKITGNNAVYGGVYLGGGTFNMYGGEISHNRISGGYSIGGGVSTEAATEFNLCGGSINNNYAQLGGGVHCRGEFSMSGGAISYNTAVTISSSTWIGNNGEGGGLYLETHGKTVTLSGGEISYNKAGGSGGGICLGSQNSDADSTTLEITGNAKIHHNEGFYFDAYHGTPDYGINNSGGGIYVEGRWGSWGNKIVMTGGEISDNKTVGSGIGICTYGASVEITGGKIINNVAIDHRRTQYGGGLYIGGASLYVEGDVEINGNTTESGKPVDVYVGEKVQLSGAMAQTANVGFEAGSGYTTVVQGSEENPGSAYFEEFHANDLGRRLIVDGYDLVLTAAGHNSTHDICGEANCSHGAPAHELPANTYWQSIRDVDELADNPYENLFGMYTPDTAYAYLAENITLTSSEPLTVEDGRTLYLCLNGKTLTVDDADSIVLGNSAKLVICDCSSGEAGKITGNGLTVTAGSTVEMYGGTITGCEKERGGGVLVQSGGTFTLYDGTISGNTAADQYGGGGVYVENGGTFTLCNAAEISGNTAASGDLSLASGAVVTIHEAMTVPAAPIVVSVLDGSGAPTAADLTTGWAANMSSVTADAQAQQYFTSAEDGHAVIINATNELRLEQQFTVTFDPNGGSAVVPSSVKVMKGRTVAEPPAPTKVGDTFIAWYNSNDSAQWNFALGTVSSDMTLVAKWLNDNTFKVKFHPNFAPNGSGNGSGSMGDQEFIFGVLDQLNFIQYRLPNYAFWRWTTAADGTGTSYGDGADLRLTEGGPVYALYAQWTANQYTVTFNSNNGSNRTTTQNFTYDAPLTLEENAFTRAGYTFEGWNTDEDADVASYEDEHVFTPNANALYDSSTASGVTLYAIWTPLDENENGIPDAQDPTADIDDDGIPNAVDPDDDGDGIPDWVDPDHDSDGDGVPDVADPDDDDDTDTTGTGGGNDAPSDPDADDDGDGIPNGDDPDHPKFWDGDDADDDPDDGTYWTPDGSGKYPGETNPDANEPSGKDTDGDGNPDVVDPAPWDKDDTIPDKDGDGTIDKDDEPYDPFGDDDGDGIPNASDNNDDGVGDDNIPDWYDPHVDTDGDGVPNWKDTDDDGNGSSPDGTDDDDDGDGILDVNDPDHPDFWEPRNDRPEGAQGDSNGDGTPKDTDGDGRPDVVEADDDNDGTPDQDERDRDGDGDVDRKDDDDDSDGDLDVVDPDDDNDGIPDWFDPDADSDGDGIPDIDDPDKDGDGIPDVVDPDDDNDGEPDYEDTDKDTDGDGDPDVTDPDDDNDGDLDGDDDDDDNDGVPDNKDPDNKDFWDTDGDGNVDEDEKKEKDSDSDGDPDVVDPDDDNDGVPDTKGEPTDPFGDPDGDGIPNASDNDNDGDGIPDWYDPQVDSDGDGVCDGLDADDDDPTDTRGNGSGDDSTDDDDDDGDGIKDKHDPDHEDFWKPGNGDPAGKTEDATDPNGDNDDDVGEKIPNAIDSDNDGDGSIDNNGDDDDQDGDPDLTDSDDDNDGIPDWFDPDADSDNDGIPDIDDPDKDGDGVPDVVDPDDDNDDKPDYEDTDHDTDGDGDPDVTDPDDDGDGDLDEDDDDDDGDGIKDKHDPDHEDFWDPNDGDDKDKDTDSDGNPDIVDPNPNNKDPNAEPDRDGDKIPDKDDEKYDPAGDPDGDGIPNASDNDDDGDNIPDWHDPHVDTDNDGEPNWKDPDDDGSGISPDDTDDDDDGDGILDVNDPDHPDFWEPQDDRPEGAQDDSNGDGTPKDTDSDDRPDVAEEDDDNDGTPDQDERDRDGDGKVDRKDDDDDGDGTDDLTDTDDDNDGIPDIYDPDADSDGDGVPDWMDEDPLDPNVPESGKDDGDGDGNGQGSGSGSGGGGSVIPSKPSGEEDKGKKCPCDIFGDIEHDSWYHDAVDYVYNGGLMEGMPGSLFAPCSDSTRAQVVMILWRLEGKPAVNHPLYFADVSSSLWYIDALRWANSEEVAIGYDDGRFGGNDAITREQLATVMWRFAKLRGFDVSGGKDVSLLTFSDAKKVSAYAVAALQWACSEGIIDGTVDEHGNVLLDPQGHATRAQLATILMRFCEGVL